MVCGHCQTDVQNMSLCCLETADGIHSLWIGVEDANPVGPPRTLGSWYVNITTVSNLKCKEEYFIFIMPWFMDIPNKWIYSITSDELSNTICYDMSTLGNIGMSHTIWKLRIPAFTRDGEYDRVLVSMVHVVASLILWTCISNGSPLKRWTLRIWHSLL